MCRVVKLTSPKLNYVIVFGAAAFMLGNVFIPTPVRDLSVIPILCIVSAKFVPSPLVYACPTAFRIPGYS